MLSGSCNCGRYEVDIVPSKWTNICHCLVCRKRSGSTTFMTLLVSANKFTLRGEGEPRKWDSKGESSQIISRYFCQDCGSPLYHSTEDLPGHYGVAVGLFPPQTIPAPGREAYLRKLEKWEHKYECHYSLDDNGGF